MLTGVKIHNMHSIKDAELKFDKGRYQFLNEYVLSDKVSNPIALYGRNGTGKSSFVKSIGDLVFLLVKGPTAPFPFVRNLYCKNDKSSSIHLTFTIDEYEYEYGLTTDYEYITEEELVLNGMLVFSRNKEKYSYDGKFKDVGSSLFPVLRAIGANISNQEDPIYKAYNYLANIALIRSNTNQNITSSLKGATYIDNIVDKSDEVKKIVKSYGSFPVYDIKSKIRDDGQKQYFVHIETDEPNDVELPIGYISDGMISQSNMLSILLTLPKNGVLIIDEIEFALHPLTIKNFINEVIKRNIQLIFTSHNTNVLSYLRPDNIIFANWKNGKSSYKRLHEIYENIREVNNIEKMYLSSTFDEDIEK